MNAPYCDMNRVHVQLYGNFVISGRFFQDIVVGETRRIVFQNSNGKGVSGKVRYHAENQTSSFVLNVDEFGPNYFFISVSRGGTVVANIDYNGEATVQVNNQFVINETEMSILHNPMPELFRSAFINIDIGSGEYSRIDVRVNNGSYYGFAMGALAPIMARANGNNGMPRLRAMIRQETSARINDREQAIAREFVMRFLHHNELAAEAEQLFMQIWSGCGLDRFIR